MQLSENLVSLVGHLAWPVGALITLVIIRKEVIKLIKTIREKLADPMTSLSAGSVKIGPEFQSRVNSNVVDSDQIKDVLKNLRQMPVAETNINEHISKVKELVTQYEDLKKSDDKQDNIMNKNKLVAGIANYIFMHNVPKEKLVNEDQRQGMIAAVAEAIRFDPHKSDIYLLLKIADKVEQGHAGHKILQAMDRLYDKWFIPHDFKMDIIKILDKYQKNADKDDTTFLNKIEQTRRIMMTL